MPILVVHLQQPEEFGRRVGWRPTGDSGMPQWRSLSSSSFLVVQLPECRTDAACDVVPVAVGATSRSTTHAARNTIPSAAGSTTESTFHASIALGHGGLSGTGHGVFATPMLQPPVGNSALSQWRPPTPMFQPPVGNPVAAGWIAPYGVPARIGYGQNQIANPMGGFGGGGGAGFGHFAFGDWGFSLPYLRPLAEILQMPLGSPAPPVWECTICKRPTTGLWTATTVQGTLVGTPLPLCDHCHSKIFTFDRPLRHLHQHLASTAVGLGAGSILAYLVSIGRYGGNGAVSLSRRLLQHQLSDPAGGSVPSFGIHLPSGYGSFSSGQNFSGGLALSAVSPWCVVCNNAMAKSWDWLPMCQFCVDTAHDNREIYRARATAANANAGRCYRGG